MFIRPLQVTHQDVEGLLKFKCSLSEVQCHVLEIKAYAIEKHILDSFYNGFNHGNNKQCNNKHGFVFIQTIH